MIEVEQRQLYDPAQGQRGDCWKCCLASVLELAYEDVPHFVQLEEDGLVPSFWNATQDFLRERRLVLAPFVLHGESEPLLRFGSELPRWHFSAPGHWIASVSSPRFDGEHALVMHGSAIAWDPHPLRAQGHKGFTGAYLLVHV